MGFVDDNSYDNYGGKVSFLRFLTGENTYTGLITLDDINNKKVIDLSLGFIFDDEEVEGITSDDASLENFISISFHAVQYNGEEIVPYSE